VVSAAGADRGAGAAFQRAKGDMEAGLRELKFGTMHVLRPGPVLGIRPGSGVGDYLGLVWRPLVNPLLGGQMAQRRAIAAEDLAAAMLGAARSQRRGVYDYSGQSLRELAAAGRRPA
jgi:uncharacterized protein YbjT (DUF2867 family)